MKKLHNFYCDNDKLIKSNLVCDLYPQCNDLADEISPFCKSSIKLY